MSCQSTTYTVVEKFCVTSMDKCRTWRQMSFSD